MSRIRSVHPGLFTDPEFLQVGMAARMLLIGLWTEADDRGVFEWKPLALKIKLFPVDSVDMEALLAELVGAERIRKVEHEGKSYGICRKFCKYQRPKNPSEGHPFNPAWGEFVALKPSDSRSPTPALPQEGVKTPADGEERREEKEEKKERAAPPALFDGFEDWWKVYPKKDDKGHARKEFAKARKRGIPLETLLAGAERYRDDPKRSPDFTKNAGTWLNGECWGDEGAVPPPGPEPLDPEQKEQNRLATLAWAIDKGMINIANNYPAADVRKLLASGRVTREQCDKIGIAA